ncbi:hypothetical protein NL676_001340 [Syzygium grande]|nr:hypothetical protein NL676_001340 [Syzygium grande]
MFFVGSTPGVQSVALVGNDKDRTKVVGERVDAVKLTTLLRKNVGFAEIVTVGKANAKKTRMKTRQHSPSSGRTLAGSRTVKSSTSWIHTHIIANPHARSCRIDKD